MLLGLAIVSWVVIAVPSLLLVRRYAYGDLLQTPIILGSPETLQGFWRVLGLVLIFVPTLYLLVTLGMVAAWWSERGWLWGIGSFLVAGLLFGQAQSAAQKRAANEIYTRHLKRGAAPEEAAEIAHFVMERRQFWPPGEERHFVG